MLVTIPARTCKTQGSTFLLFSVFQELFAMDRFVNKRSSAHVLRSFAISSCFLAFILDQKSPAAVRWLPRRGRRSVEASLVQLSHKIHSHGFALCCQTENVISVPLWFWHPSLEHDGGPCDVDQHILSGFLQSQVSYQAMYLSFARVVDIENGELRVSVLFACFSVRYSGNDELRVCLVFLLFRSAPNEFFCPSWVEADGARVDGNAIHDTI